MVGFDGVPDVVFQVLQRVMETHAASQNAEQQLVVNSAPGQHHSSESSASQHDVQQKTDMNPVQGFKRGWELAEVRTDRHARLFFSHITDQTQCLNRRFSKASLRRYQARQHLSTDHKVPSLYPNPTCARVSAWPASRRC